MKDFGVLFDLDGTVLNTDELIFETFRYVFSIYKSGYVLSDEELLSFLGPSLKATFSKYFDQDLVEELIDVYREWNHSHHNDYVTIYPTVLETIHTLKEKGYPLAIVTTKLKDAAYIGLKMFDLDQVFDVVLGMDEVTHPKPDPEGIYIAMKELHVDKGIYIGDNITDIQAGKNAHILTGAIKWSKKGYQDMERLKPDMMIDEMKDIIKYIEEVS